MSHLAFRRVLAEMFGDPGWQKAFARGTGLSPSTVSRYASGEAAIPLYVALIVEMLRTYQRNRLPLPDTFETSVDPNEIIRTTRACLESLEGEDRPRWLDAEAAAAYTRPPRAPRAPRRRK